MIEIVMGVVGFRSVDVLMETKGGKKSPAVVVAPSSTKFPRLTSLAIYIFSFHLLGISSFLYVLLYNGVLLIMSY
jgi:hypothetical protein